MSVSEPKPPAQLGEPKAPAQLREPKAPAQLRVMNPLVMREDPKARLVTAIRGWVHMDNLAESHQRQAINARTVRAKHEAEAVGLMRQLGLTKSKIQISGAELHLASHRTVTPLSWKYLEREVPAWAASVRLPAEQARGLLKWLQDHREYKESEELEKSMPAATSVRKL